MKKLMFAFSMALVGAILTGCGTERTRVIREGEDTEATSGISESNIRLIVKKTLDKIDAATQRYEIPGQPRVVNMKPIKIDTMARGSQVSYLAESIAAYFAEEMTNSNKFQIYDEEIAQMTGTVSVVPDFVMMTTLMEQNVRRDNGNFYKENTLHVRLIDWKKGVQIWQSRVPLQKAVDKANVL